MNKQNKLCFENSSVEYSSLPENCSAKQALYEALRPAKRPKGRPQTTWLEIVKNSSKK